VLAQISQPIKWHLVLIAILQDKLSPLLSHTRGHHDLLLFHTDAGTGKNGGRDVNPNNGPAPRQYRVALSPATMGDTQGQKGSDYWISELVL